MLYDIDYFIKKFEAIPEQYWCVASLSDMVPYGGSFIQAHCAFGHCGIKTTTTINFSPEAYALKLIFRKHRHDVTAVNDGLDPLYNYNKGSPRERILLALTTFKHLEAS